LRPLDYARSPLLPEFAVARGVGHHVRHHAIFRFLALGGGLVSQRIYQILPEVPESNRGALHRVQTTATESRASASLSCQVNGGLADAGLVGDSIHAGGMMPRSTNRARSPPELCRGL
jgi:hypothetical protein